MRSMTIRLSDELYEQLELAALIADESKVSIVRRSLTKDFEARSTVLNRVKQAIAEARSRGPASEETVLKMAELAAQLDDSEGLGEVRVVRTRAKGSRRKSRKGSPTGAAN